MAPRKPSKGCPQGHRASKLLDASSHKATAKVSRPAKTRDPRIRTRARCRKDMAQTLPITKSNQQTSPLLRLPPELRNEIYGYVLGGKTLNELPWRGYWAPSGVTRVGMGRHELSLLQTCRQIHAEAAVLPFSLNTFVIHLYNDPQYYLRLWKKRFQAQIPHASPEAITSLSLKSSTWSHADAQHREDCEKELGKLGTLRQLPNLKYVHLEVLTTYLPRGRRHSPRYVQHMMQVHEAGMLRIRAACPSIQFTMEFREGETILHRRD